MESESDYWRLRIEKNKAQKPKPVSDTLKGVVVFFTGTARSSRYEMERLVFAHGGECLPFLARKRVTHVVAENMALSKVEKELRLMGSTHSIPVVHPRWLYKSIENAKKEPTQSYLIVKPTHSRTMSKFLVAASAHKENTPPKSDKPTN